MPTLKIITLIKAPRDRVFDLARSIDAHMDSTPNTDEKAIDGRTSGLIALGECVTWEARHFGVKQKLKAQITEYDRPIFFTDEMIFGAFKSMRHRHSFKELDGATEMCDEFEFYAPLGILGRLAELCFLTKYMESFLLKRNRVLKDLAESQCWKRYLRDET